MAKIMNKEDTTMQNLLINKGIIAQSGEICKDKISLVATKQTDYK